uniref:Uncharacterized protein n=1 Tax=Solanum lycopersicum TaxID=4081 RepID=A0A3Q7GQ91_SOLLC
MTYSIIFIYRGTYAIYQNKFIKGSREISRA